jgi:hypothetical protein
MPDGWQLLYDGDSLVTSHAVISSYSLLELGSADHAGVTVTITQHAPDGVAWWALFRSEPSDEVDINGHHAYRTSATSVAWMPDPSTLIRVEAIGRISIDLIEFSRSLAPADLDDVNAFLTTTSSAPTSPDPTTPSTDPPGTT